ncbi:MAG: minor capsid protein [Cyanobacteria bacterium P01_A01_bin.17]
MKNEPLLDTTTRHAVYLERLKSGQVNQLVAYLKQLDKKITQRLATKDLTAYSRSKLEVLLASVTKDIDKILDTYRDQFFGDQRELALYEAEFEQRNLDAAILGNYETKRPSANQVIAAIFSAPLSVRGATGGKLLEPFVRDWSRSERDKIVGAIRQGFFEGQTTETIVRAVRGTRANRFTDGILNTTSRNARAVVRTAVQHVASTARAETWKANKEIVKGYRWVATLDSRTTQQCRSLDGQVFRLGKGPLPPIHIQCRSTTVADLDNRFSFLSEGRTRSSKDGPVTGSLTYYEWLKGQPKSFQVDALGPTRAKLFRQGGLSAERFARMNLDRDFMPLTLAEMKEKEPNAFLNAFGED